MIFTRRDVLRWGLAAGGAAVLPVGRARAQTGANTLGPSPATTPFVVELPRPPFARAVSRFATQRTVAKNTVFYQLHTREALHSFHPQLPKATIWGYNGLTPGPTFKAKTGVPNLVRFVNELPANHTGFGVPLNVIHRHGGFQASEDDGFPSDIFAPGQFRDFSWTNELEEDFRDAHSTLWYHDHLLDFTGQNVYKGLAGFFLNFDALDSDNEKDTSSKALRLPSGEFDVPLVFQDRQFDPAGNLVYDVLDLNGFLGDKMVVNGAIQPFLRVARRKYRFRCLNGANARFFELFLSTGQSFTAIATDDHLLPAPISVPSFRIAPAERVEVVIDFSSYKIGDEILLQNRLVQTNGRGPDEVQAPGTSVLKFIVSRNASDPSQVPATLRPKPDPDVAGVRVRRTFRFARSHGGWVINDEFFDEQRSVAQPRLGETEIWTLENGGGGWFHPIHIHLDEFHILDRNGAVPPVLERARKDTVVLGPNDRVRIIITFHKFRGRYVFHCHNIEHEDMRMMARFDTTI